MKDLIAQVEAKELTLEQALKYAHDQGKRDAEKEKCTIKKLEEKLKSSLDDAREEILESQYPGDYIMEHIDSTVSIYNYDLAETLTSDITLGFIDDCGLLPEGKDLDVFSYLRASIYERLTPIGYEWLEANKGE